MEQEKKCCGGKMPICKILGVVVTVFLVVYISVLTWNEVKKHDYIGRESQQTYTISIDGEGKVTATPDIAEISLGLQTENAKVADAQKENTTKMNRLIDALKAMKIESKDIQTTNYSIYPNYDYPNGKQTLKNYFVTQNVTVKIRNLDNIGTVLEKAGTAGANQIGSLSFTIDEPEQLKQQAREIALANAQEKAAALAKIAGVRLGKLVSFVEMPQSSSGPIYAMKADSALGIGGGSAAVPAPNVQAGSQDIIIDVSVTYEVL